MHKLKKYGSWMMAGVFLIFGIFFWVNVDHKSLSIYLSFGMAFISAIAGIIVK